MSILSFFSPPVVGGGAAAGSLSAAAPRGRRRARPSSPRGFSRRWRYSSDGSRRKAGARAASPASPMAELVTEWSHTQIEVLESRAAGRLFAPAIRPGRRRRRARGFSYKMVNILSPTLELYYPLTRANLHGHDSFTHAPRPYCVVGVAVSRPCPPLPPRPLPPRPGPLTDRAHAKGGAPSCAARA